MKKITLLLVLFAFALIGRAQVLLDETLFDFPTTDNTATVNGWTNWSGNFNGQEPNLTDYRILDKAGLSYADLSGVPFLSGQGAALHNVYVGLSATKTPPGTILVTYKAFSATPITTGVIYTSFFFQPMAVGGSQGQAISLSDSLQRSAVCLWIRPGASGSTFKLGITRSSGGSADIVNGTTEYNYGTVNFIVMKYDLTSHVAYLYVNPTIGSASEPTEYAKDDGTFNPLSTAIARTAMQYLMLSNRGSNKANYYVSGLRVCQSWGDAVAAAPLPKVSTPTISAPTGVDVESFWANWTPTKDANGYTILVYNGTNLFSKTTVTDKTASTFLVTGLVSNTTYTYEVQADGDMLTTGNSAPSASSGSFTTLNGVLAVQPNFSDGTWGTVYPSSSTEPAALSYPSFANVNYYISNGLNSWSKRTGMFLPDNPSVRDTVKYWIKLDKSTATGGSYLTLPSMKQFVGSMELHVLSGGPGRTFLIQELAADGSWKTDYSLFTAKDTLNNKDTIMVLKFNNSYGTKLRIINTGSGYLGVGVIKAFAAKVSTPAVGSASNVDVESFQANWTPTTDANGYTVSVYNGTNLFSKTVITDKTASMAKIPGLVSNTTYTFGVQAAGDNITTGISDASAASGSFTTLDGVLSVKPDFSDGTWGTVYPSSVYEPLSLSYPSLANGNYYVSNGLNSSSVRVGMSLPTNHAVNDTIIYWIKLDRSTALGGSYLELPSMKAVTSMELHVFATSPGRTFLVQEHAANGSWKTDYALFTAKDTLNNRDTIFTLPFSNNYGTKFRITNTGSGYLGVGVVKVIGVISGIEQNTSNVTLYGTGKTIVSSQPGMLSIYNLQGVLVYKETIENRRLINLATGVYIVRLKSSSDGSLITRKVLIQ